MPRIAICYRRADTRAMAFLINERLVEHYGQESVFFDIETLDPGTDFRKLIISVIRRCDVMLAIIGPKWLRRSKRARPRHWDSDDWVRIEIETALQCKIPIVPVLVEGATMPAPEQLPDSIKDLAYIHAAAVDAQQDFHFQIGRLIRSIDQLVEERHKAPEGRPADPPAEAAGEETPPAEPAAPEQTAEDRDFRPPLPQAPQHGGDAATSSRSGPANADPERVTGTADRKPEPTEERASPVTSTDRSEEGGQRAPALISLLSELEQAATSDAKPPVVEPEAAAGTAPVAPRARPHHGRRWLAAAVVILLLGPSLVFGLNLLAPDWLHRKGSELNLPPTEPEQAPPGNEISNVPTETQASAPTGATARAGRKMAAASQGGPLEPVAIKPDLSQAKPTRVVAASPDKQMIATAGDDGMIRLWDAFSFKLTATLAGHGAPVYSIDFWSDGNLLASAGFDGTVRIWDLTTKQTTPVFTARSESGKLLKQYAVAFDPAKSLKYVNSGGEDGVLWIWDIPLNKEKKRNSQKGSKDATIRSLSFAPNDSSEFVSGAFDGTIRFYLRWGRMEPVEAHSGKVLHVAYSPDGTRVVSAGT